MKRNYIILIISCCIFCISCGHYLKEYSQDLVYASNCTDLDEIMIGDGYMTRLAEGSYAARQLNYSDAGHYYPYLHIMDDDVEEFVTGEFVETAPDNPVVLCRNFYTWQQNVHITIANKVFPDYDYPRLYKHIGYLNVIISYVEEFKDDPEELRRRVRGEALFLRGAYYYLLVNLYAQPYVKESAEKDLGVPLNLTEYIEDRHFSRNSVAEVYRQIIDDLKGAIENLEGITQPSIYRADELDARLLLSRVYLYMGDYQAAIDECNKIIDKGIALMDYNDLPKGSLVNTAASPEIFFTQGSSCITLLMIDDSQKSSVGRYRVSDELYNLYSKYEEQDVTDLRKTLFFQSSLTEKDKFVAIKASNNFRIPTTVFDAFMMRAAEVYLNKAEAQAMLDQNDATNTLRILMEKRYKGNKAPDISNLSGEALVKFIREERRRELCFEGHRWFDLRRYAVAPKYPEKKEIKHNIYDPSSIYQGPGIYKGTYLLKEYGQDNAWVMPIPDSELEFNEGLMIDNPKREERPMLGQTNE